MSLYQQLHSFIYEVAQHVAPESIKQTFCLNTLEDYWSPSNNSSVNNLIDEQYCRILSSISSPAILEQRYMTTTMHFQSLVLKFYDPLLTAWLSRTTSIQALLNRYEATIPVRQPILLEHLKRLLDDLAITSQNLSFVESLYYPSYSGIKKLFFSWYTNAAKSLSLYEIQIRYTSPSLNDIHPILLQIYKEKLVAISDPYIMHTVHHHAREPFRELTTKRYLSVLQDWLPTITSSNALFTYFRVCPTAWQQLVLDRFAVVVRESSSLSLFIAWQDYYRYEMILRETLEGPFRELLIEQLKSLTEHSLQDLLSAFSSASAWAKNILSELLAQYL